MKMKIEVPPIPKPRMTRSDKWKKRPSVLKYWNFKSSVQKYDISFDSGQVDVIFFVQMPKSWSKKKQSEMDGQPHRQRPDLDNYIKALNDAVHTEDSHIHTIKAMKKWTKEKGHFILNI